MADLLDYRFGEMDATNNAVRQRLSDFRTTLEDFKNTYVRLAGNWGGAASENAGQVAQQLDTFGNDTAGVVNRFLNELTTHLEESMATERTNTGLFSG
jgi:uncharacterized protein YukE